ncbi:MAG TPA: hypothetical protein VD735_01975 [Candidatus Saccharimonadales bacterium]|nr:hypothetical protein [Candidatus Saccharimonadales bacterium]
MHRHEAAPPPPPPPGEQPGALPFAELGTPRHNMQVLGEHVGHIVGNLMPVPKPTEAQLQDPNALTAHNEARRDRRVTLALAGTMAVASAVGRYGDKIPKYGPLVKVGAKVVGAGAGMALKHHANKQKASIAEQQY